jgi:hypothetical protein
VTGGGVPGPGPVSGPGREVLVLAEFRRKKRHILNGIESFNYLLDFETDGINLVMT